MHIPHTTHHIYCLGRFMRNFENLSTEEPSFSQHACDKNATSQALNQSINQLVSFLLLEYFEKKRLHSEYFWPPIHPLQSPKRPFPPPLSKLKTLFTAHLHYIKTFLSSNPLCHPPCSLASFAINNSILQIFYPGKPSDQLVPACL